MTSTVSDVGASGWQARVAFQADIGAALQQARQRAYDDRSFYRAPSLSDEAGAMSEEEYVAWGIAQTRALFPDDDTWEPSGEEYRTEWQAAQVVVTGPDSLLASQPYSGTHSIIDMTHVADEPGYNAVAPASAEYLQEIFGTTQPTTAAVGAAIEDDRIHGFARWHGLYVIGYRDGQPEAIFFVGYSGD